MGGQGVKKCFIFVGCDLPERQWPQYFKKILNIKKYLSMFFSDMDRHHSGEVAKESLIL